MDLLRTRHVSGGKFDSLEITCLSDADWFYKNIRHWILTDVNARYDAPLSDMKSRYPVIIFTHGQER